MLHGKENLTPRTRPLLQNGQLKAVDFIIKCPECAREVTVRWPLQEVVTLLNGGAVPGVGKDALGWRARTRCSTRCKTNGAPTVIDYRVSMQDILPYLQNMRGRV